MQDLGFGVVLHDAYFKEVIEGRLRIDFFEVMSDDYIANHIGRECVLREIAGLYPLVMHGVSMSIGTSDPLNTRYLIKLRTLAEETGARWISDHLCWTGVGGIDTHELLPLPLNEATLRHVIDRVRAVQDVLGRQLVLENTASYQQLRESLFPEWEFLSHVVEATDCAILLDLNNVYVSARNQGFDPHTFIDSIPIGSIIELHVGGHQSDGDYLLDTHDQPVSREVWDLYSCASHRFGPISTILEWDSHLPSVAALESELAIARSIRGQATSKSIGEPQLPSNRTPLNRARTIAPDCFDLSTTLHRMQAVVLQLNSEPGAPSSQRLARDSLRLYALSYRARHMECLRRRYPILLNLLVDDFDTLAESYIYTIPPSNVDLATYASKFAPFLSAAQGADHPWGELVSDVAMFEWGLRQSFESPVQQCEPSSIAMPKLESERLYQLKGELASSVRLFQSEHTAYFPPFCEKARVNIKWSGCTSNQFLVYKYNDVPQALFLEESQYDLIQRFSRRRGFKRVVDEFVQDTAEPLTDPIASALEWISAWIDAGILTQISEM
jgi:uncharacterized protein (UPF0276 family)